VDNGTDWRPRPVYHRQQAATGVWPFSKGNPGDFTIFAAGDFLLVSKVGSV
jgi:hypothetical protein